MTEKQLQQIEERAAKATPGPWYAHATDNMHASNARYISVEPGNLHKHDNRHGMEEGNFHQARPERVVAITLLQAPSLARADACNENSVFIAHARHDVPALVVEVRRLQREVAGLKEILKQCASKSA